MICIVIPGFQVIPLNNENKLYRLRGLANSIILEKECYLNWYLISLVEIFVTYQDFGFCES